MTITKKTRLLAAPFVGTRIRIKLDDPESLAWGIYTLTLAEGREKAVIDWGDGASDMVADSSPVIHTYAKTGDYEIRISDDISGLRCSTSSSMPDFRNVYAPMIREFFTNSTLLGTLENYCFDFAINLRVVSCARSGVRKIMKSAFYECISLAGRLDFPGVEFLASGSFRNCTEITELHFDAANEATIRTLSGFDTKFGAENATVFFDL